MYTAFADKRSVVLHAIERTRTPIRELVCAGVVASACKYKPLLLNVGTQMHGLERALVLRSTTNAYFSPPYARGLETHWDLTDVFVLQVQGQGVCGGDEQWLTCRRSLSRVCRWLAPSCGMCAKSLASLSP